MAILGCRLRRNRPVRLCRVCHFLGGEGQGVFGQSLVAFVSLLAILVSYGNVRPFAIFPKWSTVRRSIKHVVRVKA